MEPQSKDKSQKAVNQLINHLDQKVWDSIAVKAIDKMAPHKLKHQSVRMFTDFTGMTSVSKGTCKPYVSLIHESTNTLKENYILGTSKLINKPARTQSSRTSEKQPKPLNQPLKSKNHKRVRTETILSEKAGGSVKGINQLFRLTDITPKNQEQQRVDQEYRNNKYSDQQYAKRIEQASRQLQAKRQQRTAMQSRKFKQLKAYTYDFQGKLMSRGQQKPNSSQKVVHMKQKIPQDRPEFTEEHVTNLVARSRKTSETKMSKNIENKKVIHQQKFNYIDQTKEKRQAQIEQDRAKRRASFVKNASVNKFQNIFNKETRVSVGVSIIDLDDRSRVTGSPRNKTDIRNLKLTQFKDHSKKVFNSTRLNSKGNLKETFYKTEGDQPLSRENMRLKTDVEDYSSKITTYRKFKAGRGIIHIKHRKLYTENFSPERREQ